LSYEENGGNKLLKKILNLK